MNAPKAQTTKLTDLALEEQFGLSGIFKLAHEALALRRAAETDAQGGFSFPGGYVTGDKASIEQVVKAFSAKDRCGALDKMITEKQLVRAAGTDVTHAAFAIGEPVIKSSGYDFPGIVRAVFITSGGAVRYVVEHATSTGLLHIFNEGQLTTTAKARANERLA